VWVRAREREVVKERGERESEIYEPIKVTCDNV
jgi:hypothetical protein